MHRNSKYKYTSMFNEESKMIIVAFPGSEKNPQWFHKTCAPQMCNKNNHVLDYEVLNSTITGSSSVTKSQE